MKKPKRPKSYYKKLVKALEHDLEWFQSQLMLRANVEKALRGDLADAEARAEDHELTSKARGMKLRQIGEIASKAIAWPAEGHSDPVPVVIALANGYKDECARVDELESRPFTATVEFAKVDPELIKILTGETTASIPAPVGGLVVGEHYDIEFDTTPLRTEPEVGDIVRYSWTGDEVRQVVEGKVREIRGNEITIGNYTIEIGVDDEIEVIG